MEKAEKGGGMIESQQFSRTAMPNNQSLETRDWKGATCDLSQGSSAHICISCVSSMKLGVFETPAMHFTTFDINDATFKRLPLSMAIIV